MPQLFFMEDLIELYLFKNKKCPLPEIGTLQLTESNAVAWYAEKRIEAPVPSIKLTEPITDAEDFISFISQRKNISRDEAVSLLGKYCSRLQNMDAFGETKLPHSGKFYVNADGNLVFKPIEVTAAFLPQVNADRVLHASASHDMVVGDKQTTTVQMTAYFAETADATKSKWWIWAIGFALAGIAALIFFFNDQAHSSTFGNSQQIQPTSTTITYRIAE